MTLPYQHLTAMKTRIFIFLIWGALFTSYAQTRLWVLDFETPGGYQTSMPEQTDSAYDYFLRTDGSDISSDCIYRNPVGSYFFAAQDLDADGMSSPATLTVDSIDISGYTNLQLKVYLAEDDASDGNEDWDATDYLHIDYDIDFSNNYLNGIWVENDGTAYNSAPYIDTDYDGTGDGAEITDTFTQYSVDIAQTGNWLSLRITFGGLTSSDEDIAIDHLEIWGEEITGIQIINVEHSPDPVTSSDEVNVSAEVLAGAGVAGVELHWGYSSGNLTHTISMSLTSGNTYATDSPIPAHPLGTTVYYEVYAIDNNANDTTSPEYHYTVVNPPYLVITELAGKGYMADYKDEYIEITNLSGYEVNLDGWTLEYYESTLERAITFTSAYSIADNDAFVIAVRTNYDDISPDYVPDSDFSINNDFYVILKDPQGNVHDQAGSATDKFNDAYNYEFTDCYGDNLPTSNWNNLGTGNGTPGTVNCVQPEPEITVEGNNIEIADGDTTPQSADGTDFGNVDIYGGSQTHTFVIKNTGNADLTVNSVSTDNSDFTVGGTTSGTVAPGAELSFTVTFSPSSTGTHTATITIDNNDADENPYDFVVQGTGTYSAQSDIVENATYTYTSNIPYLDYQGDPITNTTHSVGVFKFDIRDGGDTGDADDKGTELTSITFGLGDASHIAFIRTAALFDGNAMLANTPTLDRSAGTITFSGLSGPDFTAPDDGIKSLTLRISFTTTVTDNEQLQFIVTSAEASSAGSIFARSDAGGASSSIAGDRNRIEVIADRLRFTVQPSDGVVDTYLDPFTVAAVDVNLNKDADAVNQVTLSTSGTGMVDNSPYTMSGGEVTFTDVKFTVPQTDITLTATTSGLAADNDDTSQPFDIFEVPDGSYRTTSAGTWQSTPGGTATWEEFVNGSWQPMTGQPPTDTDKRVYIRHEILLSGTNSASDIVIENEGLLNTNGVSQTLTNLLVRNGGTYYKNSNGVYVEPDGVIEVEDGGTFLFRHTNATSLRTNMWNGTEKFHPQSNFVVLETDNSSDDRFMETPSDVSSFLGGQFGNIIIDMDDGKLLLLPDDYHDTLTKGDLIFKRLADNAKFTNSNTICVISGNLEIRNTVIKDISITTRNVTDTIVVKGNFIHSGPEDFRLANSFGINPNVVLTVEGNLTVDGTGALRPDISSDGTGVNEINLKGDLTVGESALLYSQNPNSRLNFTGDGDGLSEATTQTVDIASADNTLENQNIQFFITRGSYVRLANRDWELGTDAKVTVEAGGILDFGFNGDTPLKITISGTQTGTAFELEQGGYLKITSPDGIWTDSSAGNVQVVPSNTYFSPLATFHYTGKADQITGDAIGSSSNGRMLIVDLATNDLTLTPSQSFGITGTANPDINGGAGGMLDIRKGRFVETASAYITGSTGGLRMADGTYYKIVTSSQDASDYLPRLEGLNNEYDLQGTSTIELAGNGDEILRGNRNYRNLVFSNGGTTTLSSAVMSVTGEIYITGDAVVDVSNNTFGGALTDLRMDGNAVYRTAGTGTKPDAQGVYDLSDNSKIVFTNRSASDWQLVRLNRTYRHIEIEGTNVGNGSEVTGIRFHPGGSFTVLPGAVFKLKNTAGFSGGTATALDSSTGASVDVQSGSIIEYAGANQIITPAPYAGLTVSGSGIKTLGASEIRVSENVDIQASTLHIEDNKTLIIDGNLTNPGGTLEIDHAGSLVQTSPSATVGNGHYIVHKTASHLNHFYDYVYWSSPLSSSTFTFEDLVAGAWARFAFDATLQNPASNPNPGWTAVAPGDTWTPGRGYAVSAPQGFSGGALNVTFEVANEALNTGDITVDIYANGAGAQDGDDYNLLGNPYPSALDFDAWVNDNPAVHGAYATWTNCAGLDAGGRHQAEGYTYYTVGTGSTAACAGTGLSAGRYVNSAQGFFVEALQTGTVTFKNSHRVAGNNDNFIGRPAAPARAWVNFRSADTSAFRQILIGFAEGATEGFDRLYDAHAMEWGTVGFIMQTGGHRLAVQGLPPLDGNERRIPLTVKVENAGRYVFALDRTEGLPHVDIMLYDARSGMYHPLNARAYDVYLPAGTYGERFELVFDARTTEVDAVDTGAKIWTRDGQLFVHTLRPFVRVEVYDINGRLWQRFETRKDTLRWRTSVSSLSPGVYTVRVYYADGTVASKKVLR